MYGKHYCLFDVSQQKKCSSEDDVPSFFLLSFSNFCYWIAIETFLSLPSFFKLLSQFSHSLALPSFSLSRLPLAKEKAPLATGKTVQPSQFTAQL